MLELKKVAFAGSSIGCVEVFGRIYVSIRDLCNGIGLDYMTQLTAVREAGWDVRSFKVSSGQTLNTIRLEDMQTWLDMLVLAVDNEEFIEKNAEGEVFDDLEFND